MNIKSLLETYNYRVRGFRVGNVALVLSFGLAGAITTRDEIKKSAYYQSADEAQQLIRSREQILSGDFSPEKDEN